MLSGENVCRPTVIGKQIRQEFPGDPHLLVHLEVRRDVFISVHFPPKWVNNILSPSAQRSDSFQSGGPLVQGAAWLDDDSPSSAEAEAAEEVGAPCSPT